MTCATRARSAALPDVAGPRDNAAPPLSRRLPASTFDPQSRGRTDDGQPPQAPPGDRSGRHRTTSIEIDRRRFLTYLVSGATLTVATYAGLQTLAPASASAEPVPSGPHPIDFQDLGDILIAAYRPTFNLMRLEVLENGNVRFELPRTDVGTGITTAIAMVIADEMDTTVDNVEVPMSDARPELLYNMLTGGSCTMRAMIPPVSML